MTIRAKALLTSLFVLFAANPYPTFAQSKPSFRQFNDWMIGCDNQDTCRAVGLRPEITRSESSPFVIVTKKKSEALPSITFGLGNPVDSEDLTLKLVTDEDRSVIPLRSLKFAKKSADAVHLESVLEPGQTSGFLAMLNRNVQIEFQDSEGITIGELSLEGSRAAIAALNLGRHPAVAPAADATVAPEQTLAPESASPSAAPPLIFSEAAKRGPRFGEEIARYNSLFKTGGVCSDVPLGSNRGIRTWSLDESRIFVEIDCRWRRRDIGKVYFIADKEEAKNVSPVNFPWLSFIRRAEDDHDFVLMNPKVETASGTITFVSRIDGQQDCGAAGEYKFNGTGFDLIRLTVMPECRGVPQGSWIPILNP